MELTKTEEILLISIWRLKDEAYGVKIRQYVSNYINKEFTYGNLYSILKQLKMKGLVNKTAGEITHRRRGRRKIYYNITPDGMEALKASRDMYNMLWDGISKYAFD
ncbi:MAG: hypothetical protein GY863_18850 [bacterium]|nr:hypothetical protein [bacterium]